MAKKSGRGPGETANILAEIVRNSRLTWRLLRDPGVQPWVKAIPLSSVLYLLVPFDFLPDWILGLGQFDDVAVLLLGVKLFIELCPEDLVQHHLRELGSVSVSYGVAEENPEEEASRYIEGAYRRVEEDGRD